MICDLLGAKLVAYIGSLKETQAFRQWADGKSKPSTYVWQRLHTAYHVAALLAERDSRAVAQAWIQGMNPQLDDTPRPGCSAKASWTTQGRWCWPPSGPSLPRADP